MSDTVLSGRWVVYYGSENRQKRIVRDTSVTPTVIDSVNGLYSALQDLFDELNQMDDGTPMSAQTPTEYTIGIIDPGDKDPWFIDRTSVEYLKSGALKTASWARVQDSNVGIVRITYTTGTDFISTDIGKTITNATSGSTGTLLDYNSTGSTKYAWIRPATFGSANNWGGTSGTITVTGGSAASVTQATAAVTGESLWANIYTLGTIEDNTHIYIQQNPTGSTPLLVAYKDTTDWWLDGQIDILVNVKEVGTEIDEGVITVMARQYSKTYSYYITDLTAGGRNPVPLQTGKDLDNKTGYWTATVASSSGFAVGDVIYVTSTTKKGVITAIATNDIRYYLIGDPITNFVNGDTITNGTASSAIGTGPTAYGPAALGTPPVVTFGTLTAGGSYDIDENGTPENYSVVIDCNQNSLANVYEWCKYVTRRGSVVDLDSGTQTITGQFYTGSDYRIIYDSLTGSIADGSVVTQVTSGATGTVTNHNTTDKILTLRSSRGTFTTTGGQIRFDVSNYVVVSGSSTIAAITPIAAAPFGTFAGGKFFCAPGVVLTDYQAGDANNFQLVDDNGTVRVAPTKVTVTVGNTRAGDKIAVFRLASGDIQKNTYSATVQTGGTATTVIVNEVIGTDEPGKTSGGIIRLVDSSAQKEYRLRFSSWSTSTFTLAYTNVASAGAGTTTTNVNSTGIGTASLVGDLVYNVTQAGAVSYVTAIVDANNVTIFPAITGQAPTNNIKFNVLPVTTTTSPQDYFYVPFIDVYETVGTDGSAGSESIQVVYNASVSVRVRARKAGSILPFEQDSAIGQNGMNVNVIRTPDTIFA